MTKRDFELIARTIANLEAINTPEDVAKAFAAALVTTNSRFDSGRFIRAAMPKENA